MRYPTLAALALGTLCIAAAPPCERCVDLWNGSVSAKARVQHTALVKAGRSYEVTLSPEEANADLVVAGDNTYPPEVVLCRSARGAKSVDACRFEARADMPVHVFVVGKYHATKYQLSVARAEK